MLSHPMKIKHFAKLSPVSINKVSTSKCCPQDCEESTGACCRPAYEKRKHVTHPIKNEALRHVVPKLCYVVPQYMFKGNLSPRCAQALHEK
jgi:hypothetical protein